MAIKKSERTPKWSSERMETTLNDMRDFFDMIKNEEQEKARALGENPGSKYVQEQIYNRLAEFFPKEDIKEFQENFYFTTITRDEILERTTVDLSQMIKNDWCKNKGLLSAHYLKTIARDKNIITVNGKPSYDIKTKIIPVDDYYRESTIDDILNSHPEDIVPEFRRGNRYADFDEIEVLSISNGVVFYEPRAKMSPEEKFNRSIIQLYTRLKNSDRERAKALDWTFGFREWDDYPFDNGGFIGVFPDNAICKFAPGEMLYRFSEYMFNEKMSKSKDKFIKNCMMPQEYKNCNDESQLKLTPKYNKENYSKVMEILTKSDRELTNFKKNHNLDRLTDPEKVYMKKLERALLQGHQGKGYLDGERIEYWAMNQTMFDIYTGENIGHTGFYVYDRDMYRNKYLHNPAVSARKKLYEESENPIEPSLAWTAELAEKGMFNQMFSITQFVRQMCRK